MAVAHERIAALMRLFDDSSWRFSIPPVVVESNLLDRMHLDDLRDRRVGLCGIYGDMCVKEVCLRLIGAGHVAVVVLEDACLWSAPLRYLVNPRYANYFSPEIAALPRARALRFWPELRQADVRGVWNGYPPSL
jgi:hypothetical protein